MWKKLFAISCSIPLLCTGCGTTEVRDRNFLQALELQGNSGIQFHDFITDQAIVTQQEKSLERAIAAAETTLGKSLFWGHLELIAYQNPEDGENLQKLMDTQSLPPSCHVITLSEQVTLTETDTSLLVSQLEYAEQIGKIPQTSLFTVLRELETGLKTALVPVYTGESFSAQIVTENESLGILSEEAIAGLVWLRGDCYPEFLSLSENSTVTIQKAATSFQVTEKGERLLFTVTISLAVDNNFDAAAQKIQAQCETAIRETVTEKQADVFFWLPCVQSQCYGFSTSKTIPELLERIDFQVMVERS